MITRSLGLALALCAVGCGDDGGDACDRGNCTTSGGAGRGGTTEPYVSPCLTVVSAEGTSPLIDDFEAADGYLIESEHRLGSWYTYDDDTGTTSPPPGVFPALPEADASRGGAYAMHFSGSEHRQWGGGLGFFFLLDPNACYDAGAYGGLTFWAKGPGTVEIFVTSFETLSTDSGGGCADYNTCEEHKAIVELSADWAEYTVAWSDFFQTGGPQFPLDVHALEYVSLSTIATTSWDYWFDDVAFAPAE